MHFRTPDGLTFRLPLTCVDSVPVLASVGLHPRLFDDPDNRRSFITLGHLLETCVKVTRCRHFGLLVGARFTLDSLGILGEVLRNAPTLRDALRLATLNIELQDRAAAALTLDLGNSQAALGYFPASRSTAAGWITASPEPIRMPTRRSSPGSSR